MGSFSRLLFRERRAVLCGLLFSIAACSPSASHLMRNEALHINQFPAGEATAIDGIWKDPWGDRARIEKGRMYLVDFVYPMVVMSDLRREAPGVYRANGTGSKMILGEEFTLTLVDENQLVLKSASTDRVYYKVQLDQPRLFADELDATLAAAQDSKKTAAPLEITGLTLTPRWVAPGEPFDLSIDFSAFESSGAETIPVTLTYRILSDGRSLYTSKPTQIEAENGKPMTKTVHLKAAESTGSYELRVEMAAAGVTAGQSAGFEIGTAPPPSESTSSGGAAILLSDRNAVLDGLVGKWEITLPGYPPYPTRIERQGDQLSGRIEYPAGWQAGEPLFHLEGNALMIKARLTNPTLNCWLVAEDTVQLNEALDEMPVRSKVLDGNTCVRIGEVFKGTMRRPGGGAAGAAEIIPAPSSMAGYMNQINSVHYFKVTGKTNGQVFGTDIYTSDSHLATAAVHAGLLKPGQTGTIKVTMLPGRSSYAGSTRNAVKSRSYGRWSASYSLSPAGD